MDRDNEILSLNNVDDLVRWESSKGSVIGSNRSETIFVREDRAVVDGKGGADTVLSWSNNIEIKDSGRDDTVIVSGERATVEGKTIESYGDGAVISGGEVTITGSGVKSTAQNTDIWFSSGAKVSGTDESDEIFGSVVKRTEIETGQDDDNIYLSFSKNNKVYLGYQSLWDSQRKLKEHLIAVDKKIRDLETEIVNLDGDITIYKNFVDDKYKKIQKELQEKRDGTAKNLEKLLKDRANSVSSFNSKYRTDLTSDTTIDKIETVTKDISDGDNYCEDFKGSQNYIHCGNGDDIIILQDCDRDTIRGNGGSCKIEQKNSVRPKGNVFILGAGNDTVFGYNDKDTIIVDNHSFASVTGSVEEDLNEQGDIELTLWQPKILSLKSGNGAILIINQDLQFEGGIPSQVTIQGSVYAVEDSPEKDRFDLVIREPLVKEKREQEYVTLGGGIIFEAEGYGKYTESKKSATLSSSDANINRSEYTGTGAFSLTINNPVDRRKITYRSDQPDEIITYNVTVEPHTEVKTTQITVPRDTVNIVETVLSGGEVESWTEVVTLEGGIREIPVIETVDGGVTTETMNIYTYYETNTSDIMALISTPDQETAEKFADDYAERKRYDLLLRREIKGKGRINERSVQIIKKLTLPTMNNEGEETGSITIVGVDKVPKNVQGRFNYSYYKKE